MSYYEPVTGSTMTPGHAPENKPLEDRLQALENQVATLIAELHRHISLRLETPPAEPVKE